MIEPDKDSKEKKRNYKLISLMNLEAKILKKIHMFKLNPALYEKN